MSGQRMSGVDRGNITAWFLTGGLLGYGAVSFLGFGVFIVPVGLLLAAWFVARHPEDAEPIVLALLFAGSVTFTAVALVADDAGSHGLGRGAAIAVASGAGFVIDLAARSRRMGDDA